MIGVVACGICGSDRAEPLVPGVDAVVRCGRCGVGHTIVLQPAGAEDLFDDVCYPGYFERAEQWRHEARARLRWLLRHARPSRLMEIGCAGGFFVEAAREAQIDALGVELSAKAASYARDALSVRVHTGPFEQLEISERFDAVCAFHVLEHVQDPNVFLGRVAERLEPGGVLALEVPNIASARAQRMRSAWAGLQTDRHLWHFSPDSLPRVVEDAGLAVRAVDTVSPRLYMRSRHRATRGGLALLWQDLLATRSGRTTHPSRGDYLRLLADKR